MDPNEDPSSGTYKVIWRRLAEEDLTDAWLFIGLDAATMAEKWIDAVEAAVAHPSRGARSPGRLHVEASHRIAGRDVAWKLTAQPQIQNPH